MEKEKQQKIVLIEWEDHWYDPDGECTPDMARLSTPKLMCSVGFLIEENETGYTLALDMATGTDNFRHYAFYDKRMVKRVVSCRGVKQEAIPRAKPSGKGVV